MNNCSMQTKTIKKSNFLFFIGYTILYIGYFLNDVDQTNIAFGALPTYMKYGACVFFVIAILFLSKSKKMICALIALIIFGVVIFVSNTGFYVLILILVSFVATELEERVLIKYSFYLLIVLTIVVVILCMVGLLENVTTTRYDYDTLFRYGLGFYHSNVLPLIVLYLTCYWALLKRCEMKIYQLLVSFVLHLGLYYFCRSRNAFLLAILLLICCFIFKYFSNSNWLKNFFSVCAVISVPFYVVFSLLGMHYYKQSVFWQRVDEFFTYRLRLAVEKVEHVGISWLSTVNNDEYFAYDAVVDNGYLFVAIRYGILIAFLLALMFGIYAVSLKTNIYATMSIVIISTVNFIDNDICDYLCLPFMVLAVRHIIIGVRKYRAIYGSV